MTEPHPANYSAIGAYATLICLNNDIIDTIALACSPVFEGDKEQDAI